MVWSTKNSYSEHSRDELATMCNARKLPSTGTKLKLCNQLGAYDAAHPFQFLSLPAEIRNMIYHYVAIAPLEETDAHTQTIIQAKEKRTSKKPSQRSTKTDADESDLQGSPFMMSLTPGLLEVSRQVRMEFTPVYYSTHVFACNLFHADAARDYGNSTMSPLYRWLQSLSNVKSDSDISMNRLKMIRNLRFHVDQYSADTSYIVALNELLSENDDQNTRVEYFVTRKAITPESTPATSTTQTPTLATIAASTTQQTRPQLSRGSSSSSVTRPQVVRSSSSSSSVTRPSMVRTSSSQSQSKLQVQRPNLRRAQSSEDRGDALFHLNLVARQYASVAKARASKMNSGKKADVVVGKPVMTDDGPGKIATLSFGPGMGFFGRA